LASDLLSIAVMKPNDSDSELVTLDELAIALATGGKSSASSTATRDAKLKTILKGIVDKPSGEQGMTCGEVFASKHCAADCTQGVTQGVNDALKLLK
jgi:hypothetical protein